MEDVLHPGELGRLLLLQARERDTGPAGDDVLDVLLADHRLLPVLVLLPLPLELVVPGPEGLLLLAERGGLLELLGLQEHVLLADHPLDLPLQLLHLGGRGHRLEPRPARRLVDDVDGLVGKLPLGDVPVGQLHGGVDGGIGDLHPMVGLVLRAEALDDLDGLRHRWGPHDDGLETPLERPVLLDVLAVLVERGGADALDLAPGEGGLQHVRGVDRPLGGARPDERVQLVEEQDHVLGLPDLLHHRLEALLELAAILRSRHQRAEVELEEPLADEDVRHVVVDDLLGEALDDGRLAHPRLADQDRIVLGAAGEDLDDPLDLGLAADHGVELRLQRELREVAGELVQDGSLAALLRAGVVLVAQKGQRLLTDLVQAGPQGLQDLGRDGLPLLHDSEEQVLGADVVVAELPGLLDGQLEDPLGLGRERHLAEGQGLREAGEGPLDLPLDRLQTEAETLEHGRRDALPVPDQPEKDVLGPDEVVAEPPGFLPGQDDHPPRALGESLEHVPSLSGLPRTAPVAIG